MRLISDEQTQTNVEAFIEQLEENGHHPAAVK